MEKEIKKKHEIDMTTGDIMPKLIKFSIPLMFSGLLQLFFNAADVIVVGKFAGDNSLAAVGSVSSLVALILNIFIGLSIGSNVLAARYFGAKQEKELSETVHTSMAISIIGGLIMALVGFFISRPLLTLMRSPEEVIDLSTLYLKIYFLGMPGQMAYNFGSSLLRSKGDTKRPLIFLSIAGVLNVCLNLVFVIVFKMDVAGVALATIISQYLSAVLVITCLSKEEDSFRLEVKKIRVKADKLKQILSIGIPAGIQGMLFSISNMLIQSSVNIFGNIVVAGNSAGQSIEGFVYFAMYAVYQASISFTSQNIGAGKLDRVPRVTRDSLILVSIIGIVLGCSAYFFGPSLLSIYTTTPEAIAVGMRRLLIICVPYFTCGIMDCMAGIIRGLGRSILPMIMTLIGACGFRILWIVTVFNIPEMHNVSTVYLSYPLSWIITAIALFVSYGMIMKHERQKLEIFKKTGKITE